MSSRIESLSNLTPIMAAVLPALLLFISGCSASDTSSGVASENVDQIVFQSDTTYAKVSFERDVVYMDSLLLDKIPDIDVDEDENVYLAGIKWNHVEIHKFSAPGDYLGSIGNLGDDPGSFGDINRIKVTGSDLWVTDNNLNRISRFGSSTGELKEIIEPDLLFALSDSILSSDYERINPVGMADTSSYLVTLSGERNPAYQPEFNVQYSMLKRSHSGSLTISPLFEEKAKRYVVGDYAGRPVAFSLAINEQPLVDFFPGEQIYTANSSEFFIRVISQNGELLRTYRYPYNRLELSPEDDIFPSYTYNRQLLMVRESAEYPEYWPALYRMFLDDEQRLWVSTVTSDQEISEWIVIDDKKQQVAARFNWPVDKPIYSVRNGNAYTIEQNSAGFKIVVSYDITLE